MASRQPLTHEEVIQRLEETLLGPGHLARLATDSGEGVQAVREHLAGCATCRAEYEALARTDTLLASASPRSDGGPSPGLRETLLATVVAVGRPRVPMSQRAAAVPPPGDPRTSDGTRRRLPALAGLAAAAAILVLVGGVVLGPILAPRSVPPPRGGLTAVANALERVRADPSPREAVLRSATGERAGTVVASPATGDLVVVSTSLEPSAEDDRYACYIMRDGTRSKIGYMHFEGATAFWAGPVGDAGPVRAGDRFVVILEGAGDDPILTGEF